MVYALGGRGETRKWKQRRNAATTKGEGQMTATARRMRGCDAEEMTHDGDDLTGGAARYRRCQAKPCLPFSLPFIKGLLGFQLALYIGQTL
jgi:hypothetical protein